MSYISYSNARLSHSYSCKPRKTLRSPDRDIAFRNQYIARSKTTFVLRPFGSPHSAVAYKITEEDGTPQFTVTGRKYTDRSCREFRDDSGLPLFELHRKWSWTNSWSVSLPGCDTATIATGAPRWTLGNTSFGNFNLSFENAAAFEGKRRMRKCLLCILNDMEMRWRFLTLLMGIGRQGYRPAMDVIVMPGVDISLVATIAVIVSDWVFSSS
ncbi:hypothetical protein N7453_000950 [Penicillium expansum]|nr:hypothetical protein N7453_000950 [Penicillium expansum]